jgi:predicted unusual protein kinase regulating ubiquinone biosynthesis (AarF/ABC1/UbiB family)
VAIKVQYPDAAPVMALDLVSIRKWANFISKTEIKFDLVSAVDELSEQVTLEFDFKREARIMDTVSTHLQVSSRGFEPASPRDPM